jgi:antitoxin component YwqK of YwqJK toxin-antitoxin module
MSNNSNQFTDEYFISIVEFSNGNKLHKIFSNETGSLIGEKEYLPNGVLYKEVVIEVSGTDKLETRNEYYETSLKFSKKYKNGLAHGLWIGYYPNGAISYSVNYNNNLKIGIELSYDTNGNIVSSRYH